MTLRTLALLCLLLMPFLGQAQEKPRLDQHGFPLPEGAVARLGNLRFVTPGYAGGLALSPDGKFIATGGKTISIWNADTAQIVHEIKDSKEIFPETMVWSHNGKLLASMNRSSKSMMLRIWNVATQKAHWPDYRREPDWKARVITMRFTANDQLLAVVAAPTRPSLRHGEFVPEEQFSAPGWCVELWDVAKGTLSSTWTVDQDKQAQLKTLGKDYGFCYVALSSSGDQMAWLATRPPDRNQGHSTVFVYETASGKLLHTIKDLPRTYRVDLADEGQTLVVYPVRPAKVEKNTTLKGLVVAIPDGQVRFAFDYRILPSFYVSAYANWGMGTISVVQSAVRMGDWLFTIDGLGISRWDLQKGNKLDEYNHPVSGFAVSAQGKRLVVGEGWRLQVSDGELASLEKNIAPAMTTRPQFLADGRLVIRSGSPHGLRGWAGFYTPAGRLLQTWDVRQGKILDSVRLYPWPVTWQPSHGGIGSWGKTVALAYLSKDGGLWIHSLITNEKRLLLKSPITEVIGYKQHDMQFSKDGRCLLLYMAEADRYRVHFLDTGNGKELGRYEVPYHEMHPHAKRELRRYSDDGSVLSYIAPDQRLVLVDWAQEKKLMTVGFPLKVASKDLLWHYENVGFDRLLWARPYEPLQPEYAVWDRQGQMLRHFSVPLEKDESPWRTLLSHDGRMVATYFAPQKQIIFYETATGRRRGRIKLPRPAFEPHDFRTYVDFSPDSKLLATTARGDPTILLWDLARPLSGKAELPPPKTMNDAEKLWELLGDPDPQEADLALWALVKAPKQTLVMMKQRLQPARGPEPKLLQQLIDQLDSANFSTREKASKDLKKIGDTVLPALRAALKKPASLEQRQRLEKLIPPLEETVTVEPCLRELRALEVLERIGGKEARQLVALVAAGPDGTLLAHEARLILARWLGTTAAK